LLLPGALTALILLGELPRLLRRRPDSRGADRGSFPAVIALTAAGYWAAFLLAGRALRDPALRAAHPGWFFGPWSAWAGAALALGGTLFRVWAVRVLGRYFTVTVRVSADQRVVEEGPYRLLRHPSYTGSLLAAAGVGLALGSWPSLLAVLAGMLPGLLYRIRVEEAALLAALGEPYRAYRSRTWRLLPLVW